MVAEHVRRVYLQSVKEIRRRLLCSCHAKQHLQPGRGVHCHEDGAAMTAASERQVGGRRPGAASNEPSSTTTTTTTKY